MRMPTRKMYRAKHHPDESTNHDHNRSGILSFPVMDVVVPQLERDPLEPNGRGAFAAHVLHLADGRVSGSYDSDSGLDIFWLLQV